MAKFSNAKVGDKVFSLFDGWGRIVNIVHNSTYYPIRVYFINQSTGSYTLEGKSYKTNEYASLFWNKPVFDDPEPKRKIKKTTTRYVNLYKSSAGVLFTSHPYETEVVADNAWESIDSRTWVLVKAQPVVFEWEEEEE